MPRFSKPKQCYLKGDLQANEEENISATLLSIGVHDNDSAKAFIERLLPGERDLLRNIIERKQEDEEIKKQTKEIEEVHHEDLVNLWWINFVPFCGYGFIDNTLMIVVGESVDRTLGLYVGISVMAAAALGNFVSNLCGIGTVHYVERFLLRYFNLRAPVLNIKQMNHWSVGFVSNTGKVFGVLSGCILGMFPLLFYDAPERLPPPRSLEADENDAITIELERKENDFTTKPDYMDTVARALNSSIFKEYEQFRKDLKAFNSTEMYDFTTNMDEADD